ncbi:MAG TPA: M20/M25/M40 family metallo-hydrolase [Candidatus Limnocylindrales bacterium]|nr:M20/M25/M40 family metallo-hydrolase [Candidatus Limnocylindrales bacterium]
MKSSPYRARFISTSLIALVILAFAISAAAQLAPARVQLAASAVPGQSAPPEAVASPASALCAACVRENLEYLAGPKLHGRGSGTIDEYLAAEFIARKLEQYGVAPAAENGQYIQTASLQSRAVTKAPVLSFDMGDSASPRTIAWTHGKEIAAFRLSEPNVQGPLQKLDLIVATPSPNSVRDSAVVLLKLKPETSRKDFQGMLGPYLHSKAAMVIVPVFPAAKAMFDRLSKEMPKAGVKMGNAPLGPDVIFARPEATERLWALPDGTFIKLHSAMTSWKTSHTWNVLGKIVGTNEKDQVVLLSAHLDHLGVKDGRTYPGADDDASGTVAVMELAHALVAGPKPSRTVVFALWGSEETGMIGSGYFLKNPTFALKNIVANLEFEMIARPDPRLERDQLWLSGWERTDLGPELAEHGAKLVGDPYPDQNFFARSDNYPLAKEGIVAQTVSSFGLHKDYHQPTDTLAKVDWQHLDSAIGSMIGPVTWLVNSAFAPQWNNGQRP